MRALSYLGGVLGNRYGWTGRPRFLTYCVTFRCNARCVMCDSWKKPAGDELSAEELEPIFRQLPRLDGVRLTGGEPFLRADLSEIAALVRKVLRPLFIHLTSNGFLTERVIRFCERRRPDIPLHLLISLDGPGERHDSIRGVPSAWDMTTATLDALAPRREELNLSLSVNQTILDERGFEDYRKLAEYCRRKGLRHNAVLAYDGSAIYDATSGVVRRPAAARGLSARGELPEKALKAWLREAEAEGESWPFLARTAKRRYFEGIRDGLLAVRKRHRPGCVALNSHLRLLPDGSVPVCQFNGTPIGNLRATPFREVWKSDLAGRSRAWVRRCPGCWAECEVIPNMVYNGEILARLLAEPARTIKKLWRAWSPGVPGPDTR